MTAGWTMPPATPAACVLCGDTEDVRTGLMRFRQLDDEGNVFSSGPRCRDRAGCRERYEARMGEPWPLEDAP